MPRTASRIRGDVGCSSTWDKSTYSRLCQLLCRCLPSFNGILTQASRRALWAAAEPYMAPMQMMGMDYFFSTDCRRAFGAKLRWFGSGGHLNDMQLHAGERQYRTGGGAAVIRRPMVAIHLEHVRNGGGSWWCIAIFFIPLSRETHRPNPPANLASATTTARM